MRSPHSHPFSEHLITLWSRDRHRTEVLGKGPEGLPSMFRGPILTEPRPEVTCNGFCPTEIDTRENSSAPQS